MSWLAIAKVRLSLRSSDLARLDKLKREFAALFPERPDQLSFSDFVPYLGVMAPLREVFNKYDVIPKLIRQTRSSVDLR